MSYGILNITYQIDLECPKCGFTTGSSHQEQIVFRSGTDIRSRRHFKCSCGYEADVYLKTAADKVERPSGCLMVDGES